MSNTRRARTVSAVRQTDPEVMADPAPSSSNGYLALSQQDQISAQAGRLRELELAHYQQVNLIEEQVALGADSAQAVAVRDEIEKRIEFVRGKLQAQGVSFTPQGEDDSE